MTSTITMNNQKLVFIQPFCEFCMSFDHNFRLNLVDNTSPIICGKFAMNECENCEAVGHHTTNTCPLIDETQAICVYCHAKGHKKENCEILNRIKCTFCKQNGHKEGKCFTRKYIDKYCRRGTYGCPLKSEETINMMCQPCLL